MPLGPISLLILGFAVWIVCIAMAWTTAPRRHRDPANWAVLTFLFGPIALAALFVMEPGHWHGHVPGHQAPVDPRARVDEVPHAEHHGSGHQESHHHGDEGKH